MQRESRELTAKDYLDKIKESCNIKVNVDTKFFQGEKDKDHTVTVSDLSKKRTSLYWKGCHKSKYRVVPNVSTVKILIEDCHDCTIDLHGPIMTSVVEIWRCNNLTVNIDTEIFTMQVDLCKNLVLNYTHKLQLGSIVQAGIYGFRVGFLDYPELSFDTGFETFRDDPQYADRDPPINDKTDQFITRFVDGKLLTELIIRDSAGFHTTEREQDEFEEQKEKNDKATEETIRKMLKLAGPAVGLTEESIAGKSQEGKAETVEKNKKEAAANLKKMSGNRAFTQGNFAEAITYYSEAIEITPDNHIFYSNRCAAYYELKNYEKALEDSEKCISLDAKFPKGHFRKGQILMALKKKQEAMASLVEARDLAPKDEEVLNAIKQCERLKV